MAKLQSVENMNLSLQMLFSFYFQYVQNNKEADNDWFRLESNKEGTRWFGKCWYIHNLLKYEFEVEFEVRLKKCKGLLTNAL